MVFEEADPLVAAASLLERDPGKSLEIARRVIARGPAKDLPRAHDLAGIALRDQHKTEEAIAEMRVTEGQHFKGFHMHGRLDL